MTARAFPTPLPTGAALDGVTAFPEAELRELADELRDMTARDGYTSARRLLRAARVLEVAARGDLEVIRCTCDLWGPATCPVCS